MSFSDISTSIQCPRCKQLSLSTDYIGMQIKILDYGNVGKVIKVGDMAPLREDPEEGGYIRLKENCLPARLKINIIEDWTCMKCSRPNLWAMCLWENQRLISVEGISLTVEMLSKADYISLAALDLFDIKGTQSLLKKPIAEQILRFAEADIEFAKQFKPI